MRDFSKIPASMRRAADLHFKLGIPISDLAIERRQKENMTRVKYVYQMFLKKPQTDVFPLLFEMAQSRYKDGYGKGIPYAHHAARRDELLFFYIVNEMAPHLLPPERPTQKRRSHQEVVEEKKRKQVERLKKKELSKEKRKQRAAIRRAAKKDEVTKKRKDCPLPFLRIGNFCQEYGVSQQSASDIIYGEPREGSLFPDYALLSLIYHLSELADYCRSMAISETSIRHTSEKLLSMNHLIDMETVTKELFNYNGTFRSWRTKEKTPEEIELINKVFTQDIPNTIERFIEKCRTKR